MYRNAKDANIIVRFTGLGIIGFNQEDGHGEIAVIRHDNDHKFFVSIWEEDLKGQKVESNESFRRFKRIETFGAVGTRKAFDLSDVEIHISATSNPLIENFEIFQQNGEFNRLSESLLNSTWDKYDFRWIVDMDEFDNSSLIYTDFDSRNCLHSKIFIRNAEFFNDADANKPEELYFQQVGNNQLAENATSQPFGSVGQTIGAAIVADEVKFEIMGNEYFAPLIFRKKENIRTIIDITNTAEGNSSSSSDMDLYYKCFTNPPELTYQLVSNVLESSITAPYGFNEPVQTIAKAMVDSPEQPNNIPPLILNPTLSTGFCHPVKAGGDG